MAAQNILRQLDDSAHGVGGAIVDEQSIAAIDNAGREYHVRHEPLPFEVGFGYENRLRRLADDAVRLIPVEQKCAGGVRSHATVAGGLVLPW
jgi:hypothetical protein